MTNQLRGPHIGSFLFGGENLHINYHSICLIILEVLEHLAIRTTVYRASFWCHSYHSEKYEFVSWEYEIPVCEKINMFQSTNQAFTFPGMRLSKS